MGDVKRNVKARVPALCKQAQLVVWSCHKSGLNSNTFDFSICEMLMHTGS